MNNYQSYRDVQSFWVDKAPSHWKSLKNKHVFTQKKEIVGENWESFTLLTMGKGGVKPRDMDGGGKFPESFEGYQVVKPEQLIFCLFDLDETPRTVGLSKDHGMITSAYDVFSTTEGNDPQYWTYFYQTIDDHKGLRPYYTGLRKVIRYDTFMGIDVYSPPLEEQKLISRYLDQKVNKIDSLIDKTQQRKNLIKESIRTYFFEVRLKNIKINQHPNEWFQCLPDGWEIVKFRQLFEPIKITNNPSTERLLSVTQDKGVVFRDEQDRDVVNPGDDVSSYKLVEPGDVIISLRSADGGLEISDVRGLVSPAYIVLRPKKKIDRNFYRFLLTSKNFIVEMNRYVKGIRDGKNIYFDDIKDVLIPYLPFSRWDKNQYDLINIHQNLVNSFGLFDRKIKLLEEYKQSLISSVVTGKVRVTEEML